MILMADPDAQQYFVRDITSVLEANWRWTHKKPQVKLPLVEGKNWKYVVDFSVPSVSLQKTGPVTISFLVNNRVLGSKAVEKDGRYQWEKDVPASWITPGKEVLIGAEIDKTMSVGEGVPALGFILTGIGLEER